MAERDKKLSKSRLQRASKLGGVAAGHAARNIGTRAANVVRSDERSQEALGRQHLETAERIVDVLGTMKGAAMKLGQTFSVLDVGLVPDEYREEFQAKLAKLQAGAEPRSFRDMRKVMESDLGEKLGSVFADIDEEPIAAASIGQVHRATLPDGRDVAVKVQYPRIREAIQADLQNLGIILKLLARISPGLDTKEVAEEIALRITEELDYELEAQNHRALAREYKGHPFVLVPPVVTDLSRERMIVTEYVEGRRFEEIIGLPDAERSRLSEILFRFYVNGPLRHRLLNGDPHPGNSLFLADGRVAFLDFGFFKQMTKDEIAVHHQILRAVYDEDAHRLYEIMREQNVVTSGGEEQVEVMMDLYRKLCSWFMVDEEVTLSPAITTEAIVAHGAMRKGGFGDMKMPAEQIVAARAFMLVLAIGGQLAATNNWNRIAREVIFGDPPQTELGRLEAEHLGVSAV